MKSVLAKTVDIIGTLKYHDTPFSIRAKDYSNGVIWVSISEAHTGFNPFVIVVHATELTILGTPRLDFEMWAAR